MERTNKWNVENMKIVTLIERTEINVRQSTAIYILSKVIKKDTFKL